MKLPAWSVTVPAASGGRSASSAPAAVNCTGSPDADPFGLTTVPETRTVGTGLTARSMPPRSWPDATAIVVQLLDRDGEGEFRVTVRDNGRGLSLAPRPGATGLRAMENRAATIGAELTLTAPEQGAGTLVELRVPVTANTGGPR